MKKKHSLDSPEMIHQIHTNTPNKGVRKRKPSCLNKGLFTSVSRWFLSVFCHESSLNFQNAPKKLLDIAKCGCWGFSCYLISFLSLKTPNKQHKLQILWIKFTEFWQKNNVKVKTSPS